MTNKISDDKKEAQKPLTNVERIEKLKIQQEQLREAFIKVQGAIEMLETLEEESK